MDGEKSIFHRGESSQEKHGGSDSPYRCWFQRNNRFHAEGSSSSAPAPAQAPAAQVYGGAPGWRFQPSDFEMVKYFLPRKTSNQQIPYSPIQEANIYYYDPIKLLEYQEHAADGRAWYFFTTRERKYPNGERPRRDTGGTGLRKAVGKFHNILDTDQKTQIGVRHQLDYYEVKPNDTKLVRTDIKMTEYVLETKDNSHAETKKRNNESKDGNKKNKPHPDGEEDEENQKQFHALALCKIWIKGDKTLQEYYYPAVPNVEANPEPSFMKMDTAAKTDETFQQHNNEALQEYNPAVPKVEANPEPSFMNMDTAVTDETLQQDVNEILQESDYDLFGDLETLLPQLLDPVQPPDINQVMGTFGEPSPSFDDNNWPLIEQNAISDYFYI